jgi:hypothetical protein
MDDRTQEELDRYDALMAWLDMMVDPDHENDITRGLPLLR